MESFANSLLNQLPSSGSLVNCLPHTSLFRVDDPQPLTPLVYKPSIYFVAQGEKEAWLDEQRFVYNANNYLLLTVPLPLRCRVFNAKPNEPFLAVKLDIDLKVLNELLTQLPNETPTADQSDAGILVSTTTPTLRASVDRLLSTFEAREQQAVLAPMYYREILFHILQGPQARLLRDFATTDRQNNRVAMAINYIHQHFTENIRVEDLANIAAMSPSTFYEHFKTVTRHSPLQYLKNIRLHNAKDKIQLEQLPISEAAFFVGYESASQFSREYKRLFGESPSQHANV